MISYFIKKNLVMTHVDLKQIYLNIIMIFLFISYYSCHCKLYQIQYLFYFFVIRIYATLMKRFCNVIIFHVNVLIYKLLLSVLLINHRYPQIVINITRVHSRSINTRTESIIIIVSFIFSTGSNLYYMWN